MPEHVAAGKDRERIEHIIVLMMENRSFDHLLGFLPHPDPDYPGVGAGQYSCPVDPGNPGGRRVAATATATPQLGNDPGHSHRTVMLQIGQGSPVPMDGFVESYRRRVEGDPSAPKPPAWKRVVGRGAGAVVHTAKWVWAKVRHIPDPVLAAPDHIMRCFPHSPERVLGRLALDYAVLANWHASVPGETWLNRQYAHAATSHGTADIELNFYDDETVYERLGDGRWGIYQDGVAQVWAFAKLWQRWPNGSAIPGFHNIERLYEDIASDRLPAYSFVEPNHGFGGGEGNSQHPANNTRSGGSFLAGEALMGRIHDALVEHPAVFEKTLLLITYDEHGGFYDHVEPRPVAAPDEYEDKSGFDFKLSGIRVPAVAISPLIPPGTLVRAFFDHASIPATVLRQFAPNQGALTYRDAEARNVLDFLPLLETARTDVVPIGSPPPPPAGVREIAVTRRLDDLQAGLVQLAGAVSVAREQAGPEADRVPPFVPKPATRMAAAQRQLDPHAARVVDSVVTDFEREGDEPDPADAEIG